MKKTFSLLCGLFATSVFNANAQEVQHCATDIHVNHMMQEHPEMAAFVDRVNKELDKVNLSQFARTTDDETYYDVPVVIHIIHDYGAENVKDNVIYDLFKEWQEVFEGRNPDTADVIPRFKPIIGNPRIRLHLAKKDPNGNPTTGITRRQHYLTTNGSDNAKMDYWPNNQYLNIWFVKTFSAAHSGAAAYAYYPSSGAFMPYYDGIIGIYDNLTVPTYNKAIPHEIGHCLNLQHVWGNSNNAGVSCGDDGVTDTPPTRGHVGGGCSNTNLYDTNCSAPDTNNAQNIMDYAYCMRMFTEGQATRMLNALTSNVAGRNNLYSSSNLAATGVSAPPQDLKPVPEFSVERGQTAAGINITSERAYFLCANHTINFGLNDRSWRDTVTAVQWTLSNGPTATSLPTTAGQKVVTQFSEPGWVTVTLKATGNNTGDTTITTKPVFVAAPEAIFPINYTQNFSSDEEMAWWPMFNYYNNTFMWERYTGAGVDDNSSIRFKNFDNRSSLEKRSGSPVGDKDDVMSPAFDLSEFSGRTINFNFYTAGARSSNSNNDSLQIMASTDCGTSWFRCASIKGTDLTNNGNMSTSFAPSNAGQWKARTIEIPETAKKERVFFKFRYFPTENGNNVYVDKFSISPWPTEVNDVANNSQVFTVYPNPAKESITISFKTGNDGNVSFAVRDITGKVVYSVTEKHPLNTVISKSIPTGAAIANGMYMVSVTNAQQTATQKVMVEK